MGTWQHWVNFIVGLWIIVSSFLNLTAQAFATNLFVSGAIVAILALWGALQNQGTLREVTR